MYDNIQEPDIMEAKRLLLRNQWKKEAGQIPLSALEPSEQILVQRCLDEGPFMDDEVNQLEQILGRYREAILEYAPDESMENMENNVQLVEDEKTFIDLIRENRKNQVLPFYYPLDDGRELKVELEVKPLTDSRVIEGLTENLQDFQDFTQKEQEIIMKQREGNLSREEQVIYNQVRKRLQSQQNYTQLYNEAIEFLSQQTSFKGRNSGYELMKEVYQTIEITYVMLLYQEVARMMKLRDVDTTQLFRTTD